MFGKLSDLSEFTSLGMLLLIAAGRLVYHMRFEGNAFSLLAGIMPTARSAWVAALNEKTLN